LGEAAKLCIKNGFDFYEQTDNDKFTIMTYDFQKYQLA
jgi:hypothetical protein